MIEVNSLSKKYGNKLAVDNISFKINPGEVVGFLGPNGAGKSTTMNILTGYISATSGTVAINEYDILNQPQKAKSHIGFLPENPPLYLDMTVKEYLSFIYDLKKIKEKNKFSHISELCHIVKIENEYGRLIKNLSKGYRQRVGLAGALLGNPDVIILDEPTVGLDPKQMIEIRNLIKNLGKNHTVILSSHILPEVQAVCDRVLVINNGKIVADDTPSNLSHTLDSGNKLTVRIKGNLPKIESTLKYIKNIKNIEHLGQFETDCHDFSVSSSDNKDIRSDLFFTMASAHLPILKLTSYEFSLEEIFLDLTKDTSAPEDTITENIVTEDAGDDFFTDEEDY